MFPTGTVPCASHLPSIELYIAGKFSDFSQLKKKIVGVGAGPGGLEASRIAAERGHDVVVFEAASDPGGQVRLCAKSKRRKDMMGIIDWRMQQCNKKNVKFNFNVLAEKDDVLDENCLLYTSPSPRDS